MVLGLAIWAQLLAAQPKPMTWNIAGTQRRALVFAPTAGDGAAPLVFVFHGHGGNMHGAPQHMAVQNQWPRAIVVYPQGLDTASPSDPEGAKPGWQHAMGENGDRDLKFVDAMISTLSMDYRVNPKRIYTMDSPMAPCSRTCCG